MTPKGEDKNSLKHLFRVEPSPVGFLKDTFDLSKDGHMICFAHNYNLDKIP